MKYIHSLYIGLLSLLFVGCQEEQLNNMQTGGFQISLQDVAADITTKTLPKDLEGPIVSNFHLKITNENNGISAYDGAYISDLIPASTGVYSITATHGDNPPLAKDNPYYKGDTTGVKLEEDQVASVELKCRVANALASVVYTSEAMFKEVFTDYGVKVGIGNLTLDLENGTTESAYYQAGSIPTFTFVGTLKGNGKEVTKVLEDTKLTDPSTFAAGQHCKITLSLSTTTSGLNLHIEKVEATPVTITATIPMEWLPKPKVEAEGFIDDTLTFVETETPEASIKLSTASALQDMRLKFHFEDPQFEALNRDTGYLYSNPADKDIINTTLGISLSDENKIDLSSLLTKLQTKAGETTNNSIEIDAKANNRWSSEEIEGQETPNLKYTLTCVKPEFSVSIQKENCWSREFTIDEVTVTSGNVDIIKNNLVYQYYNGQEWLDCATRENIKGRTQQFTEAAEDLTTGEFEVRALYRGTISSTEATVILETPTQLPNSGMEEWSTIRREEFRVSDSWFSPKKYYYSFYPYISNGTDIWWNTNNDRSQDGNIVLGMGHPVCFAPCVSYTENEKHSDSRAALIYTSGHGGGYISTGEVIYEEGAFAGSLFIGTYSWSRDNGETITKGHTFSSRPTTLKFWYNYVPKNTDTFQAYVELKNGEELVGSGTFISSTSNGEWKEAIINIEYVDQPKKATSIYVQFLSTTKTSFSESDFDRNKGITFPVMGDWNAHIGSMLYIDDISLVYDK